MTITFGGVELKNVEQFDEAPVVEAGTVKLTSGRVALTGSSEVSHKWKFDMTTDDYADVIMLQALIGLKLTLSIHGDDYYRCAILSWDKMQPNHMRTEWNYAVTIGDETA